MSACIGGSGEGILGGWRDIRENSERKKGVGMLGQKFSRVIYSFHPAPIFHQIHWFKKKL